MTAHCNFLGKFELSLLPHAPGGVPQFEVMFGIDAHVSCVFLRVSK